MVAEALGSEDRAAASGPVQGLQVLAGDPAVVADVHDLGAHLAHRERSRRSACATATSRRSSPDPSASTGFGPTPRSVRIRPCWPCRSPRPHPGILGGTRQSSAAKAARVSALASSCDIRSRRW